VDLVIVGRRIKMSVFYCDYHDEIEDSDVVGFNAVGDREYCDDAIADMIEDAAIEDEIEAEITEQYESFCFGHHYSDSDGMIGDGIL
jgi:hypothetical protein